MGRNHLFDDTRVATTAGMGHRLALVAAPWVLLVVVWVALWGDLSSANLVAGVLVATGVTALTGTGRRERLGRLRLGPAVRFVAAVAWNLVQANALVAWEVLTRTNRIQEGIVAVELPSATPSVLASLVTVIGLTPGTVVVDVDAEADPCVLYVHVLHLRDIDAVRADIRHLEALALAAFGPDDAAPDIDHPEGRP